MWPRAQGALSLQGPKACWGSQGILSEEGNADFPVEETEALEPTCGPEGTPAWLLSQGLLLPARWDVSLGCLWAEGTVPALLCGAVLSAGSPVP